MPASRLTFIWRDRSPDGGEEPTPTDPEEPSVTPPGEGISHPGGVDVPNVRPPRPAAPARAELPATGSDPTMLVIVATALVVLGGTLVLVGRRTSR